MGGKVICGKLPEAGEPVVFLDFDDVVNVFGEAREHPDVVHAEVAIPRGTVRPGADAIPEDKIMPLAWRPGVVEALRPLNCIWISSWKALTQSCLNPVLGFDFGYVDWHYRGLSDDGAYGKVFGVKKAISQLGNVPYAIVDDSIGPRFAGALPDRPRLLIAPAVDEGLSDGQLRQLLAFIGGHGGRTR